MKKILPHLSIGKIMKKIAKQILPPFILNILKIIFARKSKAEWQIIKGGNLFNRSIYIDAYLHKEMVKGDYDQFFSNYLSKLDLKGKVVYEIGAHIGYHAMQFAQLVGATGAVHAFEPNIFNRKRFQLNLTKNEDFNEIISIHDVAVSDKEGEIEFNFSSNVDDGKSSGSFISGAHTPYQGDFYQSIGFQKVVVKSISIDNAHALIGNELAPFLIKIDVEGAENFVLKGGVNVIEKYKPIILMEIHSIYNMYKTCEFFQSKNYKVELLQEEPDGRCFVAATCVG